MITNEVSNFCFSRPGFLRIVKPLMSTVGGHSHVKEGGLSMKSRQRRQETVGVDGFHS